MRYGQKYSWRCMRVLPFLLLGLASVFFCWCFVGRFGIFGSNVDWISQHSVIPDYFRKQFYETGELFPEFAANIGGGQNIYHFSYYGLFSPVILISYLFPSVKMGDYLMGASIVSLTASAELLYGWLLRRGFSGRISFMTALMYLLSGPMIFHSYCQIMFVNYMPFLCMAFWGVDNYFEKGGKLLYTVSVFLMILTSFYFSIGGMLVLVLYGIYRYVEGKGRSGREAGNCFLGKNIACNTRRGGKGNKLFSEKIVCYVILQRNKRGAGFLRDGIRFLWPMLVAVLMSGILLIPTAAALTGREGAKAGVSLASVWIPNLQVDRLIYTPYGIGLPTLMITVLITGFTYKKAEERVLSWGCAAILTIPFFAWALNGGLYVRDKALIPCLPLLCYLIACYLKKLENREISFAAGMVPFLMTMGLLALGQRHSEFSQYGALFLADGAIMTGCFLLFWRRKRLMFLMASPVVFLILYGSVFHEKAGRVESREFYEAVTDPAIGQAVEETLERDKGFYRLEQAGSESENAADLNRVWDRRQYISSVYSSSYNEGYQRFRKDVFGVEEPFRNDLMQSVSKNPVFRQMMGVRYLISEEEVPGYELVRSRDGMDIYENECAAPAAYVTDRIISENTYEELDFPYHQMALVYGAVGPAGEDEPESRGTEGGEAGSGSTEDREAGGGSTEMERQILEEVRQALRPAEIVLPAESSDSLQIEKTGDGYRIRAEKTGTVRAEISGIGEMDGREPDRSGDSGTEAAEAEEPRLGMDSGSGAADPADAAEPGQILFLQFQVKNHHPSQDVAVRLEGEQNKLTTGNHFYYNGNTTFSFAVLLEQGKQSAELSFGKGDYEITGLTCFLGDWGKQTNRERSGRLYQSEFHPDWEQTKGQVTAGSVDVEREGYFVTSIPYDPNFEVQVDGETVEAKKVNMAFLGFEIGKGRHDVKLVYHAPGRTAGAWCSVAGVVLLLFQVFGGRVREAVHVTYTVAPSARFAPVRPMWKKM
nr:YfhO family protein [uncultured Schaedlerella sp.]